MFPSSQGGKKQDFQQQIVSAIVNSQVLLNWKIVNNYGPRVVRQTTFGGLIVSNLHRLVELTRLKLATTRKEEKERSRISPLQIYIILIIMINHSHHCCHCCHQHDVHKQQSHQLTHQKYSYVSYRLLRGVNDPDILVKRPAESPGGMTVTIFKVGMMDSFKIICYFREPVRKKGIIWEFFPTGGGEGSPQSQNFCDLTK